VKHTGAGAARLTCSRVLDVWLQVQHSVRDVTSGRGGIGGGGGGGGPGGTPMAGMATPASGRPGLLTPGGAGGRATGGGGGRGGGAALSSEVKAVRARVRHPLFRFNMPRRVGALVGCIRFLGFIGFIGFIVGALVGFIGCMVSLASYGLQMTKIYISCYSR
jgi:hypothetical protein